MSNTRILVIGGGASGIVAAIVAARHQAEVTILERMDRIGKKILATGNGRCNLTNTRWDVIHYHGQSPEFARTILSRFTPAQTLAFFADMGLIGAEEEEGRVYPISGQASAVLDVLRFELDRLGVQILCGIKVKRITRVEAGFQIHAQDGHVFDANRVIVATGGKAAPNLGSNGSGYLLVQELGHHCIEPVPALVQLKLAMPFLKQMDGVKFNGSAAITDGQHELRSEQGELLFTTYGISGIPILQLSRIASERLSRHEKAYVDINLFPTLSTSEVAAIIEKRFQIRPDLALDASLVGFLHKRLILPVLRAAEIEPVRKPCGALAAEERRRLILLLQRWRMPVSGTQSWMRAQVTAGGIGTAEIDPESMESRIVPGLYLAGEIVDIDGDCGGYNLQWAWSSGFVAGLHAAQR